MTGLDDQRLTTLLEAAAPEVPTDGVEDAVRARVRRRRTARTRRRMASAVGVAAAAVLVTVGLVAVLDDDRPTDLRTADAPSDAATTTTATGGVPTEERGRELDRVEVPGTGDSVVPVAAGGTWFWVSRGSSSPQAGSGPRTISRIGFDGSIGPLTSLDGIPVLAQLIDDLWVVVAEPQVAGAAQWRLKRIRQLDGVMVASIPVPLTAEPLQLQRRVETDGATSVVIVTGEEAVTVATADGTVRNVKPGPFFPKTGPPPIEPMPVAQRGERAWWIEGTDVVAREVER